MTIYLILDNIWNGTSSYQVCVSTGFLNKSNRDAELERLEVERKASKCAANSYWTKEDVDIEDAGESL